MVSMFELRLFLLATTCLLLTEFANAATPCTDSEFSEEEVKQILSIVNDARARVRSGKQSNGLTGTLLPPAKSMSDLEWDCVRENETHAVLEYFCVELLSYAADPNYAGAPAPKYNGAPILLYAELQNAYVTRLLTESMDEVNYTEFTRIDGLNVVYNNETVLEPLANVIRDNATKIGCSKFTCPFGRTTKVYFSMCITDLPTLKIGEVIYEGVSTTTTTKSTTTTTTTSTTTTSPTTTTTTPSKTTTTTTTTSTPASAAALPQGTNTKCTSNTGMTDDLRIQFLDMHNYRRSELAKGNVARKNGNLYPTAANMARMSYDCTLETEALSYAKQCPNAKSGSANVGENFFRVSGLNTWADGVSQAVTSWWKVVRASSSGVGVTAVTFRQVHVGTEIESWSQMAWATTNKVGCSIVKCLNEYVVDCRYLEKGNVVEKQVYMPGALCSMCTKCNENGLCV